MSNASAVKRNLDRLRNERGWSLSQVAEASQVPLSTLKDVSRTRYSSVDLVTVERLAGAFGVGVDEMLIRSLEGAA